MFALRLICALLFIASPVYAKESAPQPLAIATQEGTVNFRVEAATTPQQQEKGLMFRKNVPDRSGMIFFFGSPRHIQMWMKNTLVPLDMIFIDAHGIITQIAQNTTPESTRIIASDKDASAVLEVAGGTVARYHIIKNDKIIFPGFQ